jgi:hypothetical protein
MHRYLWLVAALIVGCGHHSTHGVPTDGGADVTLYGAAFPEQVPLAALTKSGATDGQVATWSATAATWLPHAGGGGGSSVSCDGGELVVGADGGYACTFQMLMGAGGSPIIVNNGAVAYMPGGLSALNGAFSYTLTTTTTTTTPSTALSLPLSSFSNSGGNITAIVTGKVPSSATAVTQTWVGLVTDNGGTCAVMTTGGTFAATTTGSTGTVAATPVSVALSSCSIVATVTGTSATTWHWSMVVQYAMAGP